MTKPLLLISNDDGIQARGIQTLWRAMAERFDTYVVAPDSERSATSHALTLGRPLRVRDVEEHAWSVDGTPADCIYVALFHLLPRRPDIVVSGINHGPNLGIDVFYSGTVAAAVEAAIRQVPSFAISLETGPASGFDAAAEFAVDMVDSIVERRNGQLAPWFPEKTVLNVNVPNKGEIKGYRFTRMGQRNYRDSVEVRTDPRGRNYYWIGGPPEESSDIPDGDVTAVKEGYVAITPLHLDLTAGELDSLGESWHIPRYDGP